MTPQARWLSWLALMAGSHGAANVSTDDTPLAKLLRFISVCLTEPQQSHTPRCVGRSLYSEAVCPERPAALHRDPTLSLL